MERRTNRSRLKTIRFDNEILPLRSRRKRAKLLNFPAESGIMAVYFRPSDSLTVRVARPTVVQTTSAEILLKKSYR